MKLYLKQLAVLLSTAVISMFLFGWANINIGNDLIAAPVAPLYQLGCPSADGGDIGVPTWLCTQLTYAKNNDNALRTGTNAVDSTQATTSLAKAGGTMTGPIKANNTGFVMGASTAGVVAESGKVVIQSADAGLIKAGAVGNDFRVQTNLTGSQRYFIENITSGGADAGHYMHMVVQGATASLLPSHGYYRQAINIGLSNVYGTTTNFTPRSPSTTFSSIARCAVLGGTFAGGENVTVRIIYTIATGSTLTATNTYNATQACTLALESYLVPSTTSDSFQDYVVFTNIAVSAKTDQASTTVTATQIFEAIQQ